jgi:hypothetical protein
VFDWLVDHEGKQVTVEVGCRDPRTEQLTNLAVVRVATTLGRVRRVEELKTGHGVLRAPVGAKSASTAASKLIERASRAQQFGQASLASRRT